METIANGNPEETMETAASVFDFSKIESRLMNEEALKNASWQHLLREYEPWLVREYVLHSKECTPGQQARWKDAVNQCHQKMQKRTRMFTILFAVLAIALFAETLLVTQLTLPIRGLMLFLASYCSVNCWSHWLLNRKYAQIE